METIGREDRKFTSAASLPSMRTACLSETEHGDSQIRLFAARWLVSQRGVCQVSCQYWVTLNPKP